MCKGEKIGKKGRECGDIILDFLDFWEGISKRWGSELSIGINKIIFDVLV